MRARHNHFTAAVGRLEWLGVVAVVTWLTLISSSATAGNFAVSPILLDLDSTSKSGAITISNFADNELKVQIRLYEWVEDGNGADSYQPSDDLLYFPRLATIAPGAKQIVRVGLRGPSSDAREKSYRLFIEELPEKKPLAGTQLGVAVRFGVPLFVKPPKEELRGEIESIRMEKGHLHVMVRNSGNVHFRIESVTASAGDLYSAEVGGWYLLPVAKREYQIAVPSDACIKLKKIDVVVKTERLQFEDALNITPSMCSSR